MKLQSNMDFEWYDDPCFDGEHIVDGKVLRGDEWREYMRLKEEDQSFRVLTVAGVTFRQAAIQTAIQDNDKSVSLLPEPDNKFDKNAVKVQIGAQHVGYVPRGSKLSLSPKGHVLKWSSSPPQVLLAVS